MSYGVEGIFCTPIYCAQLENQKIQELNVEFLSVFKKLTFHNTPDEWGNPQKLTTINFKDNIIEEFDMEIFQKMIDDNIMLFMNKLGFANKSINYKLTSWITSNDFGDYAPVHNHLDADISGVYYYQTNGNDGNIFFLTPALVMTSSIFSKFANNYHIKPEVGKLIMFPGWLQHGVTTNRTQSNRKSLAFNIDIDW